MGHNIRYYGSFCYYILKVCCPMTEKDINLIKTSHVAMAIINKALKTDKSLNIFYIDASTNSIDSKSIECQEAKQLSEPSGEDDYIFPNVNLLETGKIPGFVRDELEIALKKFPQPLLPHLIKAVFEIANTHGQTDQQRAMYLGIGRGKYGHWRRKLRIK